MDWPGRICTRGWGHRHTKGQDRQGCMTQVALAPDAARTLDKSEHGKAHRGCTMWPSWGPY